MKRLALLGALLLAPSLAMAAYQNPTVEAVDRKSDGGGHIVFKFTGNAGEPVVLRTYVINAATTATAVRNWVDDTLNELNLVQTASTLPALQQGQTVTRLARVTPARAAKEVWNEKAERYKFFKDLGLTSPTAVNDLNALLADINATYQAGYVNP